MNKYISHILILLLIVCVISCSHKNSKKDNKTISKGSIEELYYTDENDTTMAIDLQSPFDFPLYLAGNFGELRPNHFHGGLDFKTQGTIGHDIHATESGYVSAIEVEPWGYGRAIFITHPNVGLITVYGHLNSFAPKIQKYVIDEQISKESFSIYKEFEPGKISIEKGEIIGQSGNAGSSAGPHLHFETREIESGNAIDPLPFFVDRISDTTPPEVRSISLIPIDGATVDGNNTQPSTKTKNELNKSFSAWGKVVPAIEAYDKMNNTSNIFGVKHLILKVEGQEIYHRIIDKFDFKRNRAINSLIYYPDYIQKGLWNMSTLTPSYRPLHEMVKTTSTNGVLYIFEEKNYHCEFTLIDEHKNSLTVPFIIKGEKAPYCNGTKIPQNIDTQRLYVISDTIATVALMPNTLLFPTEISLKSTPTDKYLSPIISVGKNTIPAYEPFFICIPHHTNNDLEHLCLVRIINSNLSYVDSKHDHQNIYAQLTNFGNYALIYDNQPPIITTSNKNNWDINELITLQIHDNISGIDTYKCHINGKFVIFDYDGKTSTISYKPQNLIKGKEYELKVQAKDKVGNESTQTFTFTW